MSLRYVVDNTLEGANNKFRIPVSVLGTRKLFWANTPKPPRRRRWRVTSVNGSRSCGRLA